jgi:antitoxin component of MazEF toxin-antitoxin module
MIVKLWSTGNSIVVTIPKAIVRRNRLTVGDVMAIDCADDRVIKLRPVAWNDNRNENKAYGATDE